MNKLINSKFDVLKTLICSLILVLTSTTVFSQDPGGGPDGPPPAVPLDDYLLVILAVIGLVVAFVYFRKKTRHQSA